MYLPAVFAETDLARLHDFVEHHSFGILVSQVNGLPVANHLPFLLERATGPRGCLIGHMARANPQWRELEGQNALVVFPGPHVYISPTWYEAEQVVPTWNYAAVHIYGGCQVFENEVAVLDIVKKMVQVYEQNMPAPWSFNGSEAYAKKQLAQIVGFRIQIEKMEGKWKLNQNHPVERRSKVIEALKKRDDENSRAIVAMMRARQTPGE